MFRLRPFASKGWSVGIYPTIPQWSPLRTPDSMPDRHWDVKLAYLEKLHSVCEDFPAGVWDTEIPISYSTGAFANYCMLSCNDIQGWRWARQGTMILLPWTPHRIGQAPTNEGLVLYWTTPMNCLSAVLRKCASILWQTPESHICGSLS